ncbi:hypothetical protein LINPERPRIM_LOCUS11689 [Linum perenne]
MEEPDRHLGSSSDLPPAAPPPLVSLSSFTPVQSRRRLSSYFTPTPPLPSSRNFAWLSLQGRIVNAEEASSSKSIGGSLGKDEIIAWELFTPIQRFLIVAVIGVAASESRKNRTISQLKKSVELRDEVLSSMQQKLDNLCDQMVSIKGNGDKDAEEKSSLYSGEFGCDKIKFVDCGCWHCDQHHQELFGGSMVFHQGKVCGVEETMEFKRGSLGNQEEQEERRMSDLSDWASSSVSASEFQQVANFAVDQDFCNLKKMCEEKDATIKELADVLQLTDNAGSKRISELEDIICRKNAVITRLKKDMLVLEQKVVQLTRVRRKSCSNATLEFEQAPLMLDNIIYDMDSLTSSCSSSSDSDSPSLNRLQTPKFSRNPVQESNSVPPPTSPCQKSAPARVSSTPAGEQTRPVSPLKEMSPNQKHGSPSTLRPKQLSANGDIKKMRRRPQTASNSVPKKRWA